MKKVLTIAMAALMASCAGTAQKSSTPAIDLANFDNSVAPQEDFYEYATGGWQKAHPLKAEYARYGSFDMLRENNEIRLKELFTSISETPSEKGTNKQKLSDLYKLGLDSVRLNTEGVAPIKADLAEIMSASSREDLAKIISKMHVSVSRPLFSSRVGADQLNSEANILYFRQGGLGMGNRDYYLDAENSAIKDSYVKYLETIFTIAGVEDPKAAVEGVFNIESALAEASSSNVELRDLKANYNLMTKKEFLAKYKGFDWDAYFAAEALPEFENLVVGQPKALAEAVELYANAPIEDLRYYLASQYISAAAPYLSDDIFSASFDFFGRAMTGTEQPKARWARSLSVPNDDLGEAVGELYVERYFPEESKERMVVLVENLRTALSQHIDALEWMSDETKAKAQVKLKAFGVKIGYPDSWEDYSTLEIDPAKSYWANALAINEWHTKKNNAKLSEKVDDSEWGMSPQTVNAYYSSSANAICFPAAILQPPFFNPDADDAVNYGAIGVVIGHEMTHGFDDRGRQFDDQGNLVNWWTEEDNAAFVERTKVLVAQYDAIEVKPGLNANGSLSLGENIADQGGLRVAHTAYMNSLAGTTPEPIDGFTAQQRFYIGYANLWGQNVRDAEIARLTKSDPHSLGKWRVNAAVRNLEDFYAAFDIKEGDAMYMPKEERVVIW